MYALFSFHTCLVINHMIPSIVQYLQPDYFSFYHDSLRPLYVARSFCSNHALAVNPPSKSGLASPESVTWDKSTSSSGCLPRSHFNPCERRREGQSGSQEVRDRQSVSGFFCCSRQRDPVDRRLVLSASPKLHEIADVHQYCIFDNWRIKPSGFVAEL